MPLMCPTERTKSFKASKPELLLSWQRPRLRTFFHNPFTEASFKVMQAVLAETAISK